MKPEPMTANSLRRAVHARAAASGAMYELSYGVGASILFAEDEAGGHGNFLPASYRRICANHDWAQRLKKSYTASARIPRAGDRERAELDCAASSDALLMNVFCHPRITSRLSLCGLLGVEPGLRPQFGVRAGIPMKRNEVDRTEFDMQLGNLFVEAKLSEGGFGTASRERVFRYLDLPNVFDIDELPFGPRGVQGYQVIRGALAASVQNGRYLVLCDARRNDLVEMYFRVLRALRSYELRSRMQLLSWQELAATLPHVLRDFLTTRYGILAM